MLPARVPVSPLGAYGLAVAAVVAATGLRGLLAEMGVVAPLTMYCAAVVIAAWYAGTGPGILATFLSIVAGVSLFPRRGLPARLDDTTAVWIFVFSFVSALIIAVSESTRRAHRQAQAEIAARERAVAALDDSEARVRQQQGRSMVLAETSHVLAQAGLDLDRIARAVVERLAESLGDLCALRLLSADGATLEAATFHHRDPVAREALRPMMRAVPREAGLLGKAVLSQQIVWRARVSAQELLQEVPATHLRAHFEQRGVHSLLIAPLLSDGRVLGTLTLLRDEPGPAFTSEDYDLLAALASRAGAAVENARLMRDERAARAEAESANRLKDEFLATLSHELRTPLNAIVGWTELLRTGELDAPTVRRALETIARNARVQTELVNDVLDVSRIISGQFRIRLTTIALPTIVESALETVRPAAAAKGVHLEAHVEPSLSAVAGDASRLQQVAWNILSNAVKFTPAGGRVDVRVLSRHGRVELVVSDTGSGIDSAFLPHVFERFRQGDATTTRRHGGLGLGLAIVRHIVELHGGTVEAESGGAGQGSVFRVRLPAMAITPAVYSVTGAEPVPEAPARPAPSTPAST